MLDWHAEAKCRNYPGHVDDFWPEKNEHAPALRAVSFCRGINDGIVCPVLEKCQLWGLYNEDFGVWGGLTAEDRRRIRRRQEREERRRAEAAGEIDASDAADSGVGHGNVGSWTSAAFAIRPRIGRPRRQLAARTEGPIGCATTDQTKALRRIEISWTTTDEFDPEAALVPDDGCCDNWPSPECCEVRGIPLARAVQTVERRERMENGRTEFHIGRVRYSSSEPVLEAPEVRHFLPSVAPESDDS